MKVEDATENYCDITPIFKPKKRLKVGTFKVISNGFRLGERFLKIIFENAIENNVDEIYVTAFDHDDGQRRLIELLTQWGFTLWGNKGEELVYVRDIRPHFNLDNPRLCFPFFSKNRQAYITAIYPEYHTDLLPDSILKNESSEDTQTLFQNIAGTATKFNAYFSGNSIILNHVANGSYTISIFDMQGHRIQDIQNAYGNETNVQLNHGTYLIRISQGKRTFGMTRAIKQK
ncbi:MAG: T9SS type A sorting domain-containing protein [Fibrobacter sp.]|nr:T9SS type A sorting domain-containing protein [Fibrobacter sp.]